MQKNNLKYFLAANSCEGFVSEFKGCYNPHEGWRAYIIKGGPGTGKSSFMKYCVAKAEDAMLQYELFPCSSDPDSLDAVSFPDIKTVILDGTAPHTVDPVYPAVSDQILNFGTFWNSKRLNEKRDEIIALTDKNKRCHKTASAYMQAAGQLITDNYKTALAATNKAKAIAFADSLCKKYIPKADTSSKEDIRFIEGISPKGIISYSSTVLNAAQNVFIIDDDIGAVSNIIISRLRALALQNGHSIITLKNPFLPSLITDHLIIPKLSLGIATENSFMHFSSEARRIHSRRFLSNGQLHRSRERIKFNKKVTKQLFLSAITALSEAKSVHDSLEAYYISAMDFEALTAFANEFCKTLFKG